MADINSLLKEVDKLGILNIDVNDGQLSPEVIEAAIDATKSLISKLDDNEISKKLQEVDRLAITELR
jgi:hypothetical protein